MAHPNVKAKIADEDHGTSYAEVRNAVRLQRLSPYAWHWDERLGWRVFIEAEAESGLPLSLEETIAMSNEDMSGEISEARRRALQDSVAPGADIHLTYEEAEELWASVREGTTSHPGVITMESNITSIVVQHGHFEVIKIGPHSVAVS